MKAFITSLSPLLIQDINKPAVVTSSRDDALAGHYRATMSGYRGLAMIATLDTPDAFVSGTFGDNALLRPAATFMMPNGASYTHFDHFWYRATPISRQASIAELGRHE